MPRRVGLVGFFSPTKYLRRKAMLRGVLGGNKSWVVLAVFLWAPSVMKRAVGRNPELLAVEKLKPGQFVRVEALTGLSKAERKAILRAK